MLALITGSSKGIGLAIAIELLQEGYDVILQSRNKEELLQLQSKYQSQFPERKIYIAASDLSTKTGIDECLLILGNLNLDIDILINNAGVFLQGNILTEKDGQLEHLMDTNLLSAYYITRALAPKMQRKQFGYIFNMCSIASLAPYPNGSSYCISKFALLGFSRCLREELKQDNVKVISILPGATWSNSWAGANLPYERLMAPEDIAKVVSTQLKMSPSAVIEEIILRPQKGDL